jgi:hypothetical protein
MKKNLIKWLGSTVAVIALASTAHATSISFNYASVVGADISFAGNSTFTFAPAVNNFQIGLTTGSAGTGSANALFGEITGTYTIGAVSGNTASVTGTGTFVIHDGLGNNLTATLTWLDITQEGIGDVVNVSGDLNMSNVQYLGSNVDLKKFVTLGQGNGYNGLTAQFVPGQSINTLKTTAETTSFSGTATAVPDGGTTIALLGLGLLGVEALRRKLQGSVA